MGDTNPLVAIQNTQDASTSDFRLPHKETQESQVMYKDLLVKGKTAAAAGNLAESRVAYQKAYKIKPTEKILQRIKKIEDVLKEMEEEKEKENDDFVQLDNGLIIYRQLVERLYPHQIEGVKWIYDLHKKRKKGGILADDMGLGKTIQVISALSAMFDMELIQSVLLVLPLSLIPNWQREFEKWAPGIKLRSFYGNSKERTKNLDYAQRRPSVCLTTYGLVVTQWEQLGQTRFRQRFVWDYVVLDEGHKIKNPSKTTKGVHAIPSRNRLILTGTPIQNNLRELWALFDWVTQGTLLGTQKTFKMEYETPITRARQRGASSAEIHLGNYMAESLRKIIDPFIMRRTKALVSAASKSGSEKVNKNPELQNQPSFPKLKKKNDFVIWTYLSEVQKEIYRDFLAQDSIKELLASKRSPLVYLTILKKICDHPRLLPRRACHQLGLEANDSLNEDDFHTEKGKECAANRIDNISDETLIEESGKLQFLVGLLKCLREEGHRTLIFSLSRKVLNIIHRILINYKFKVMRLDGTISKLSERELRVQKFQQDSSYDVFLLTTQVGGVGLTLTAADRVVIFDPSWNPATDAQAVDRIYRIGQDKNVVVYRLITCGTVEEKIYRRQIFKDSIIKQSTGDNKDPYRYFTNHDLKELFQLEDTQDSVTQRQLQDLHINQRCLDPKLEEHLAYLHSLPMFGVSDHDLMFSQDPDDVDAEVMDEHGDAIRNKVTEAQNRVELEAKNFTDTASTEAEQRWGEFDIKSKVSEQKTKEDEPVYEIEGLYDKIDSLKVDDDVIENIFNQSKISIRSHSDIDETEPTGNVIDVLDSDDENPETMPMNVAASNLDIEEIMAEDSPMRGRKDETGDMGTLEIEESFTSEFNTPGGDVGSRKCNDALGRASLLDNNISCISNQRSQDSTIQDKEENIKTTPERLQTTPEPEDDELEEEKDYFLDSTSPGSLLLPESDAEDETENATPMDSGITGRIEDSREDALKSPEKDDALDNSDHDLLQASGNSKTDEVVQSLENQDEREEEEMEERIPREDVDPLLEQDGLRRFSHLNEDSNSRMTLTASKSPTDPGEDGDIAPLDEENDVRHDMEDEPILNESLKGFFLDEEDESLIDSRGGRKKNRRRLISDSDEEDVGAENSAESEDDNEDAGSLNNFVVHDEDVEDKQDDSLPSFGISENVIDTPRGTTDKSMQKARRRSTARPLPQIDSSDESVEEDFSEYRDKTNNSSEADNSKFSAFAFSFHSEDEDIY